ncbi:hypothetical protein A3D03_04475 [Candidatus Gottesmanbacteria bacterium RIFCSPHIGHO2_02_FULL_40_13]|uniref:Uncharacterized protein n=1 Tax=Candidatus Gottesmanbacteria bacterium RIFCSPHIGHO2_02_FULL_40_13 TaxID=1798384 RepID=A0A1F6AAA3_9BACT|nr:MAG: hypothetical protein A3D03_04475 [Candidatus Gottesmanbacteria bacterium RIFCSPHIGHO2_02_FULL_40_13]
MEDKQISVKKAAELIKVTPHYIRKLLREKKIDGEQNAESGRWTVDTASLEKFRGTDLYKQDVELLAKQMTISIKEAVEDVEENFDCDIISYISLPTAPQTAPFAMIDQNSCIFLDDLLYNQKEVYKKGTDGKKYQRIGLFLHSSGGILEAAIKFVDIIRQYANEYYVIVPLMAKSAATAMTLMADKIFLTSLSELGPVDPIVQSPTNPNINVPASAIDNFLEYYRQKNKDANNTSTKPAEIDPILQKKLEDGIDLYLLGAHKTAVKFSVQEIEKALREHAMKNTIDEGKIKEAIKEFTEAHASHSYPITYPTLNKFGIGEKITDDTQLKAVKTLMIVYQQFMANSNIVKLIGNRDENKNVIVTPVNPVQQIPTRTSL